MECQTRSALYLLIVSLCVTSASRPAWGYQTYAQGDFRTGSGGLLEPGVSGQWGFRPESPWYAYGEAYHSSLPAKPRQDGTRIGAEMGHEGKRFGFVGRFGFLKGSGFPMTLMQAGGGFRLRFIAWNILTREEEIGLSREDRKALKEKKERDMRADIPGAPVLMIDYDVLNFASELNTARAMQITHLGVGLRWRIKPWITLIPEIDAFSFTQAPHEVPTLGTTAWASRAIRMVRIGPRGPYSGATGTVKAAQKFVASFHLNPIFTITGALSRIQIDAPTSTTYSMWFSFERRFGRDRRWMIVPSYEQLRAGTVNQGFFQIAFRYEMNGDYLPPLD